MEQQCQKCKTSFAILSDDFIFYDKIKVPPPTFCPECRLKRRMLFRNERALYRRPCDLCKQDQILMFPKDTPYTVYCYSCWWGDEWEASAYLRDYDFSKPFFQQFDELMKSVPRPGNIKQGNIINSDYTNRVSDLKNCYLCFGSFNDEDCMYDCWTNYSKECLDCYGVHKSERCYECVDCSGSYNLTYSQECQTCLNSSLLFNCRNCESCFGCVNLRSKSYCIFNEQYTKEEYKKVLEELLAANSLETLKEKFNAFRLEHIVPHMVSRQITDSTGNWLEECRSVKESFNSFSVEEGKYLFGIMEAKDSMDYSYWGKATELIYESVNVGRQCASVSFANECWNNLSQSTYIMNCHSSHDLFGCIGLRNKEYCILNKQYSKEEYEELLPKIKQHMIDMPYIDKKGIVYKYGEFFPTDLCPFAYNESIVGEYFPLNKEDALLSGYKWKEDEERSYVVTKTPADLPASIASTDDSILSEIIACTNKGSSVPGCTSAFRINTEELSFYRKMNIPLPLYCPNCRHHARLSMRTPLKLWQRTCMCDKTNHQHEGKCSNEFETSYSPEKQEKVYCEKCYQAEIA